MSRNARVFPYMQRLFETGSLSGLSENQLVERFARNRDQAAFELLVARHGPMVLGVCRRILNDANDVDDAFQATFLVLIRRASSLGPNDVVAAWLHGVALKVARRARSRRERLATRERTGVPLEAPAPRDGRADLRAVLDQEIERLPWKYRAPVALCYLQGLTHEEAALQLGWPIGTVKGRLARARTLLGTRLSRRGITSAAGATAGSMVLDASLQAAPAESLVAAAVRASTRIADGRTWDAVVSTSIAELARGVFAAMFVTKLKLAAALLIISGLAATGAGALAVQKGAGDQPEAFEPPPPAVTAQEDPTPADESPKPASAEADKPGDEDKARFSKQLEAAEKAFRSMFEKYDENQILPNRAYQASRLMLDAQLEAAKSQAARTAAYEGHYDRMAALGVIVGLKSRVGLLPSKDRDEVRALIAEAKRWIAKSRSETIGNASTTTEGGPSGDPEASPRTLAILARLEEPIPMNFPNETPLEDILKYIRQATQGPYDNGFPIYIDPIGLSEAEKTMTSPISIDVDGVPLRRTLQLMLKQLGLVYFVDDGLMVITSETSEAVALPPSLAKPSPLLQQQAKARRGELGLNEMEDLTLQLKLINEIESLLERDESGRHPDRGAKAPAITDEHAKALIDQMKELTNALKAAHDQPRAAGGHQ